MSAFDDLRIQIRDEDTRQRYLVSAAFRMDMEDYKECRTRFCRMCGYRCDLRAYCSQCAVCRQCQYPERRCQCENPKLQKHLSDLLEERRRSQNEQRD